MAPVPIGPTPVIDLFTVLPGYSPPKASFEVSDVNAPGLYAVGYEVDAVGKQLLIDIGRTIGICGTCQNSDGGLFNGFRAEVRGRILELSSTGPHKLMVTSAQLSNNLTTVCPALVSTTTTPSLRPSTKGWASRWKALVMKLFG
jgi:hypothetical protein